MAKLYITATHGKLGSVIDALNKDGYTVKVIGYGFPPIYVETDTKQEHAKIKEIVKKLDKEAEFPPIRADQIGVAEITGILRRIGLADVITLCVDLGVVLNTLSGYDSNNLSLMTSNLVKQFNDKNDLSTLVEKTHSLYPDYF
jgi:hypothetical protein